MKKELYLGSDSHGLEYVQVQPLTQVVGPKDMSILNLKKAIVIYSGALPVKP